MQNRNEIMGVAIIYAHVLLSSHNRALALLKKGGKQVSAKKKWFQIKRDVGMVLSHEL